MRVAPIKISMRYKCEEYIVFDLNLDPGSGELSFPLQFYEVYLNILYNLCLLELLDISEIIIKKMMKPPTPRYLLPNGQDL